MSDEFKYVEYWTNGKQKESESAWKHDRLIACALELILQLNPA